MGCRVLSAHALRPGSRRHACVVYLFCPDEKRRIEESELKQFVHFKTSLAGLLAVILVGLSMYSFRHLDLEIVTTPDHLHSDLNDVFYNEFFMP